MKKSVLASLLALATIFPGSVSMVHGQAAQPGQLTIKDPAEYNAYTNAIGQSTPAAKAAAIEAFLTQYPNSVVKNDLLEQLMAHLPAMGDVPKTLATADRLLAVDPGNLRALAISVYLREISGRYARPIRPTLSLFSTRPPPRPRRVSAPPSRRTWRMPTFRN